MSRQNEFFRRIHPEQFSDSTIIKKGKLTKEFFDFYLNSLSNRSQEKQFERFCVQIIQREICPNLLPQTGPTGGGDSKVDSETYPVSESVVESWYYGQGNKAGSERWAFAFSIKKDWKPKIKSDVNKIIDTNSLGRGYVKIFFVSNQYIADKKRADTEDDLRTEYGIDIRILDRSWIIDKVFATQENQVSACHCLGLSEELVDEKRLGERDYVRNSQLDDAEKQLSSLSGMKASEIISVAKRCVILAREIEVPCMRILGMIERYIRLAHEYGTITDQANAYYDSAWTLYWWYSDSKHFYEYYQKLETIVAKEKTLYLFANIVTLWINLYSLVLDGSLKDIAIKKHLDIIEDLYIVLSSDSNKPNRTMAARAAYQLIRPYKGDAIDDVVDTYIEIVKWSENSLEVDISQINKIITTVPLFQEAKRYDELFELLLERTSKEEELGTRSQMLARQGHALLETNPIKALSYFSRAIIGFYNENNVRNLMKLVFEMAEAFQDIGLFWAARNYYIFVLSLCIKKYCENGETSSLFFIAANRLKWLELKQGRILYSSEMFRFESVGLSIYPEDVQRDDTYDPQLAFLVFKSDFSLIKKMRKLPFYFDNNGLHMTAIAFRYELGIYDEGLLDELDGDKTKYDGVMLDWCNQMASKRIRSNTWYGIEPTYEQKSRVMGCEFIVRTDNDPYNVEFSTSLIASIECFLGTGFANDVYTLASSFTIDIIGVKSDSFIIDMDYKRDNPTYMAIKLSKYSDNDLLNVQKIYTERVTEIISIIVSALIDGEQEFRKLKELVERDDVLLRTQFFSNSFLDGLITFGEKAFDYEYLTFGLEEEKIKRDKKLSLIKPEDISTNRSCARTLIYDTPPDLNLKDISNEDIISTGIINNPLWNVCKWKGIAYYWHPTILPMLSFVFENDSGEKVFDEWIGKYGNDDVGDKIGIRIIEQIDKNNPCWYRVAVGCNSIQSALHEQDKIILSPTRLHTMQPQNNVNLEQFKKQLKTTREFYILPTIIGKGPVFEKRILKHSGCIRILKAYEVNEEDNLLETAILPTDEPIIPDGSDGLEINKILARKRKP